MPTSRRRMCTSARNGRSRSNLCVGGLVSPGKSPVSSDLGHIERSDLVERSRDQTGVQEPHDTCAYLRSIEKVQSPTPTHPSSKFNATSQSRGPDKGRSKQSASQVNVVEARALPGLQRRHRRGLPPYVEYRPSNLCFFHRLFSKTSLRSSAPSLKVNRERARIFSAHCASNRPRRLAAPSRHTPHSSYARKEEHTLAFWKS